MPDDLNSLAALAWLVEVGADEAVGEEPVNRFAAKAAEQKTYPPLEGGGRDSAPTSKSVKQISGRGSVPPSASTPPRKVSAQTHSDFSTLPQGEGKAAVTTDTVGEALALAAAANSLEELRAALEAFDGHGLKRNATHTVFADGNPAARIMLIGEAPGAEEDRQGLPFVGRAGWLLDKMLAAIGLDRSTVYITNVLPWQPPGNRNFGIEETGPCMPFLRRHIELVAPEMLVLLGRISLNNVLGISEGIMSVRGKWKDYFVGGKMIPAMPTLHPAYLLRRAVDKRLAWRDFQAIEAKARELGIV